MTSYRIDKIRRNVNQALVVLLLTLLCVSSESAEVATPHTKWAKPLDCVPPSVLVIAPHYSQREGIELCQRLEVNLTQALIPLSNRATRSRGSAFQALREQLKDDLQVLVLAGIKWNSIPEDIRDMILVRVHEGRSLLLIDPQGLDRRLYEIIKKGRCSAPKLNIADSLAFQKLPAFSRCKDKSDFNKKFVRESRYGRGRICSLKYCSGRGKTNLALTPVGKGSSWLDYDYYQALLVKTVLRLAGYKPTAEITAIKKENLHGLNITIESSKQSEIILTLCIRDEKGEQEANISRQTALSFGRNNVRVSLPKLAWGLHFIDVFLKRDGKIIDWQSTYIELPAECVLSISLDKKTYLPGETVSGRIAISPVMKGVLTVSLKDAYNRHIFSRDYKAEETVNFSFPAFKPLTVLHTVEVKLGKGKRVLLKRRKSFPVRVKKDPRDFFFVMWGAADSDSSDYLTRYLLKQCKRDGVDSILCHGNCNRRFLEILASRNLSSYPYVHSVHSYSAGKDLSRSPCLSDPAYQRGMVESIRQKAGITAPFAPLGYTLGDENFLTHGTHDFCFSPHCLDSLHKYLKKTYNTLERLNAQWQTAFAQWGDVRPVTLESLKKRNEKSNYSAWIDHRLHMESVFAQVHELGRKAVESVDQGAYAGSDGIGLGKTSFNGADYFKLGRVSSAAGGYGGTTLWSTFLPEDRLLWDWELYGRGAERGRRYPWRMLQEGGNGIGFYIVFEQQPDYTAYNYDYTLEPAFAAVVKETKRVKNGIGRLFLSCRAQYSPVALLYSRSNIHLNTALHQTNPEVTTSGGLSESLLRELWHYPDYISTAELEKGILQQPQKALVTGKYRCLVLNNMLSLALDERKAIKEFVRAGGILIANILPGVFDGHGKNVEKNDMEAVFGVKRTKWPAASERGITLEGESIDMRVADPLELTTGKAQARSLQDRPAFIVNSSGRGKTLCLNLDTSQYGSLKKDRQIIFSRFLHTRLTALGLEPLIEIVDLDPDNAGISFRGGAARFFVCGGNRYLFVLPNRTGDVKITIPYNGHVYDILKGKYLGNESNITTSLKSGSPFLLAILPYKIKEVEVKASDVCLRGRTIEAQISVIADPPGKAGLHVARIDVYDPHDKRIDHYSANLSLPEGKGTFVLPMALNDTAGTWTLKVKDIAGGIQKEVRIQVK